MANQMTPTEISFAQEQIKLTAYLHSLPDKEHIAELCSIAGCSEKKQKIHAQQFLHRRWNPHPSERFVRWWMNRGVLSTEEATDCAWAAPRANSESKRLYPIPSVKAYNCERVREVYADFLREQRAEMLDI